MSSLAFKVPKSPVEYTDDNDNGKPKLLFKSEMLKKMRQNNIDNFIDKNYPSLVSLRSNKVDGKKLKDFILQDLLLYKILYLIVIILSSEFYSNLNNY